MLLIASFGVLMVFICTFMAASPTRFSQGIVLFSQQKWFHLFEVSSRAIAGVILILYSSSTLYPTVFNVMGYGLVSVAVGLVILGSKRHKEFALWAADTFEGKFRQIGIAAIPLGVLVVYMALGGQSA